ncbi:hypothetical protein HDU76_002702 [Blyttiomyces sp. JEL0837]|nr:hypothetical protein HDU76_002702 [Blyttiomyces sp. JEL0837]
MIAPVILAALASFTSAVIAADTNLNSCVTNYDPNVNYFPETVTLSGGAGDHLSYTYNKNYKTITNTLSNETIVLYQCGTPKPTTIPAGAKVFSVPVNNISIGDTTIVTYLELLGVQTSIKYATDSTAQYIGSPCIQKANSIANIDTANATKATEQLKSVDVNFGFMAAPLVSGLDNYVSFPATNDQGVLHRVEWLGFVGSFFNKEAMANTIGKTIIDNYNCLSKSALAAAGSNMPKVAFVEYDAASDFNNQTESWQINAYQFEKDFAAAAGGVLLEPSADKLPPAGSPPPSSPTAGKSYPYGNAKDFLAAIADADIVIDESYGDVNGNDFLKSFGLTAADTKYKFVANQNVWSSNKEINANAGTEWFEAAVVEENIVLADLISIVQPSTLPNYTPTFFRNIFKEGQSTLTAAGCTNKDLTAPLALPLIDCPAPKKSGAGKTVVGVLAGVVAGVVGLWFL